MKFEIRDITEKDFSEAVSNSSWDKISPTDKTAIRQTYTQYLDAQDALVGVIKYLKSNAKPSGGEKQIVDEKLGEPVETGSEKPQKPDDVNLSEENGV